MEGKIKQINNLQLDQVTSNIIESQNGLGWKGLFKIILFNTPARAETSFIRSGYSKLHPT